MHEQARQGRMGATLAFSRVSFGYYISEAVFDYIVEAVHLLAEHAWKLLPLYRFDPRTGLWRHAHARPGRLASLHDLSFDPSLDADVVRRSAPESALAGQLDEARRIIRAVDPAPPSAPPDPVLSPEFDRIRWFPLPGRGTRQRVTRSGGATFRRPRERTPTRPGPGDESTGSRSARSSFPPQQGDCARSATVARGLQGGGTSCRSDQTGA